MNYEFLDFFKKIDEVYPDGIVNGLKERSKKLYEEAIAIAEYENKTLKEFFEDNGYTYTRISLSKMKKNDKRALRELYNSKVVKDLHGLDSNLYYKILNHARIHHLSIGEYVSLLGFEYDTYNTLDNIKEIKKELKDLYPNKKVVKLSIKKHSLYSKIYKIARRNGQSVEEFVRTLNFEYL